MKVGMNLLFWTDMVTDEHLPVIEQMKSIGYDGVEFPLFGGEVSHYKHMGQALKDMGMEATAVTVIPGADRSPISPAEKSRQGALDYLQWAIECCHALDAKVLTGPFYQPLGEFSGEPPTEDERKWAAEVHRNAAEHGAQQAGVTLTVEALNRFECYFLNTLDQTAEHVRRVDHPNFRAMFDTFHANIEEKDPVGALRRNLDVISHVHISENDRGAPGTGNVAWDGVFQALVNGGYDGWLTIEAFRRALPGLAAATRVWREFDPPEGVYEGGHNFVRECWKKHGGRA